MLQREYEERMDIRPQWNKLKAVGVPWYYRVRFINWLIAKPWKWHYRGIYNACREGGYDENFKLIPGSEQGRLSSAWTALSFPHVHHPNEDLLS